MIYEENHKDFTVGVIQALQAGSSPQHHQDSFLEKQTKKILTEKAEITSLQVHEFILSCQVQFKRFSQP